MPTYDYECSKCGHTFEKYQSIKASAVRKCPSCGRNSVKRLIGAGAGIIFKGSGFYTTDYRSDSYKQAAKADKESSTPAAKEGTATAAKDSTTPAAKTGEGTNGTAKKAESKGDTTNKRSSGRSKKSGPD